MFSLFTRLTRDEGAPAAERLRLGPRRWRMLTARLGAIVVVPLVLGCQSAPPGHGS